MNPSSRRACPCSAPLFRSETIRKASIRSCRSPERRADCSRLSCPSFNIDLVIVKGYALDVKFIQIKKVLLHPVYELGGRLCVIGKLELDGINFVFVGFANISQGRLTRLVHLLRSGRQEGVFSCDMVITLPISFILSSALDNSSLLLGSRTPNLE